MRLFLVSIAVALMAGCSSDPAELDRAIATIKETRQQVQVEVAKLRDEVAKGSLPPEQRAAWEAKLQRTSDFLVKVEKVEKQLEEQKAAIASGDPGAAVSAGGKIVGETVGGPYGAIINLGSMVIGGILTGIYKGRQIKSLKNDAIEAIGTMSVAIVNGDMPMSDEAASKLKGAQSPSAQKLVDEADKAYADVLKVIAKKGT